MPLYVPCSRYLSLNLADTPENRKVAEAKAGMISADLTFERFDSSLERYRSPYSSSKRTRQSLAELWSKYECSRTDLSVTTHLKDFTKTRKKIEACPYRGLFQAKEIRGWLLANYTPDAARRCLLQIRACCNWAVAEGLIQANPFQLLPKDKSLNRRKINPFTLEERDKIISVFESESNLKFYAPFVKFLFWSGCRTSEAVALCWRHVDADLSWVLFAEAIVEGHLKDTKNHCARRLPLNKSLRNLLYEIQPLTLEPTALVFPSKEGGHIDSRNFLARYWKQALLQLPEIAYRPQYNTRHTAISHWLEVGSPVAQVAEWCGNSPRTIWQYYSGVVSTLALPEP